MYYFDKNVEEYVSWNEYKQKFKMKNVILPDGFTMIPTFRSQEGSYWNGIKAAFEQNLVDLEVGWFVYTKFYIDHDGIIKPLVIDKSGSKLVNVNGTDVSFSVDPDDGPARRFLSEEGLHWEVTQIAILPCESESKAYMVERQLLNSSGLFES